MDAGKINKIDQSLQSVIIAYQHNAGNRAGRHQDALVATTRAHSAQILDRDSYHQMNWRFMHVARE